MKENPRKQTKRKVPKSTTIRPMLIEIFCALIAGSLIIAFIYMIVEVSSSSNADATTPKAPAIQEEDIIEIEKIGVSENGSGFWKTTVDGKECIIWMNGSHSAMDCFSD